jgi:hypothetical protein
MPRSGNASRDRGPTEHRRRRGNAGREGKAGAWAPLSLRGNAIGRPACPPPAV